MVMLLLWLWGWCWIRARAFGRSFWCCLSIQSLYCLGEYLLLLKCCDRVDMCCRASFVSFFDGFVVLFLRDLFV